MVTTKEKITILGLIGMGFGVSYLIVNAQREDDLNASYKSCIEMLEKAKGNKEITDFVYDQAIVKTIYPNPKSCRDVIKEYQK